MTKKEKKIRFKALVRIYQYLEKQASWAFDNDKDLLWYYINGRDFFFDLHFEIPKTPIKTRSA